MKKHILYACCLSALLVGGSPQAQEAETSAAKPASGGTTIATINGEEFSLGLFRLFYAERLRQQNAENTPVFQNQAFNEFVNIIVTAQNAAEKGIDEDENVQNALELQRLQLLSRLALQDAARTLAPSDEVLQKAYDERYGKDKRVEYKARHILVKSEDEARNLIAELKGGADFTELAKAHSLGPTGQNGGDLGWFDAKQMVKPFTEAVKQMEPGSHSDTPVQTQFGWHVILLEETREADPPPLDSVKAELTAGMQRETLAGFVSELRQDAKLDLNSDLIKTSTTEESGDSGSEAEAKE
jgi:peptidyl-prolyl cis-trans isomerase C